MSKWDTQPCPLCGQGVLHDAVKTISQNYKGHTYVSKSSGAVCNACGDGFIDFDDQEEARWAEFTAKVDAEEAANLLRIRKKLKLTQKEASQLTGGGKNAFSRYERGHAKPIAAVVNLFKILDLNPNLINALK
jgi:HTH-type transcriptional regulator/antitoxin MqsA